MHSPKVLLIFSITALLYIVLVLLTKAEVLFNSKVFVSCTRGFEWVMLLSFHTECIFFVSMCQCNVIMICNDLTKLSRIPRTSSMTMMVSQAKTHLPSWHLLCRHCFRFSFCQAENTGFVLYLVPGTSLCSFCVAVTFLQLGFAQILLRKSQMYLWGGLASSGYPLVFFVFFPETHGGDLGPSFRLKLTWV